MNVTADAFGGTPAVHPTAKPFSMTPDEPLGTDPDPEPSWLPPEYE